MRFRDVSSGIGQAFRARTGSGGLRGGGLLSVDARNGMEETLCRAEERVMHKPHKDKENGGDARGSVD